MLRAIAACNFWTSAPQEGSDAGVFFNIFELEMCFAPQRRAIFPHPDLQKWSERGVFLTF